MKKSIHLEIFGLAIPNVISNISVPIISSVDVFFMGGISKLHVGAIGIGSIIFNFLYWNLGFLRMGTTGMVAQAYGAKRPDEQISLLFQGLLVAVLLGALFILLSQPLSETLSRVMMVEGVQRDYVKEYFNIRIAASPASLGILVLAGWLFGIQNSWYPMIATIVVNSMNVMLSYYLVVHQSLEIKGVAWGTVIAQYLGFLILLIYVISRVRLMNQKIEIKTLLQLSSYSRFFKVNADIFLRTLMLSSVFAFLYRESSSLGTDLLAINTIIFLFLNWMSYGIDGFAFSAESMVGKYFGAGDDFGLRKSIRWNIFWAGVLALMISLIYFSFFEQLFALFDGDSGLILKAKKYKLWVVIFPILGFCSYLWDGIFIGLVASKSMRNSMIISGLIFFGVYYLAIKNNIEASIWIALSVFLLSRAAIQFYLYYKKGKGLS